MTGYQVFIRGRCDNADTSIPGCPERTVGPDDDQDRRKIGAIGLIYSVPILMNVIGKGIFHWAY